MCPDSDMMVKLDVTHEPLFFCYISRKQDKKLTSQDNRIDIFDFWEITSKLLTAKYGHLEFHMLILKMNNDKLNACVDP